MVIFQDCSLCLLQGRPGGVVEYQYTRKKVDKIPQNTPNPVIISYRAKGRCGLNQAYIYPISWRVPRTLCSGNDQGNEVSEEKYSKGEGERRNEFFSDFFRWCPTIFLAYTSIYSTDIEPTTRFYSNSPPPPIYYLFIQSQRFVSNKCV